MKHFVKKHTHHFGLWALSGLFLIWSMIWLNNLDKQIAQSEPIKTAEIKSQEILLRQLTDQNKINKNDSAPHDKKNNKQQTKPISADVLTADVISGITPVEKPDENLISVTFKFISPAFSKEFSIQAPLQNTVYEAMQQLQEQIPIKFSQFSSLGAFVEAIDGLYNDSKADLFWIYYINGQAAKLGVSYIKINPNDIITWRYETAKF
jgi:hypothetical protein